jgi:hypothetical protein
MGTFGAIWGLAGVFLLLASAVYRLSVIAAAAFTYSLKLQHWAVLLVSVFFMAYAEGYRAFQQRFSPRVAARAKYLKNHPNFLHAVFAPLFCMGYFHATRRRKITSISVTAGIVLLIVLVRLLHQPWRGIIDLSVVVGLGWGIISLAFYGYQAFYSEGFDYPPDVPESKSGD